MKRYTLTSGALVETFTDGKPSGEWVRYEDVQVSLKPVYNRLGCGKPEEILDAIESLVDSYAERDDRDD